MSQMRTATGDTSNISQTVVEMVAEAEGVDPLELTPLLYEIIDPDALDHLFAGTPVDSRMDRKVTFEYNGYEVTAWGSGYVSVREREG